MRIHGAEQRARGLAPIAAAAAAAAAAADATAAEDPQRQGDPRPTAASAVRACGIARHAAILAVDWRGV